MIIGYMRPYHGDVNCEEQESLLKDFCCTTIIREQHSYAHERIELDCLLETLAENDTLVVTRLFCLADSIHHLEELLEYIQAKGAYFKSLAEEIDTYNSSKYSFHYMVKHIGHFQSDIISEKTKNGLDEAKKKGIESGRPRKSDQNVQRAISMYQSRKYNLGEIKEKTGISKSTLYRYLEH